MLEYFRHNVQLRGNERLVYFTLVLIVFARLVSTPSLSANIARGAFYRQLFLCVSELSYDTIPQDSQSLSEIISPGVGMQRIVIFALL